MISVDNSVFEITSVGTITMTAAKFQNLIDSYPKSFYLMYNGKLLSEGALANFKENQVIHAVPRVLGGKGGFGSMLRAIGAQIEKTTNRDACRDLSGRRLRDINEEQRLKRWFAKQKQRDEEKAELKKKKLERLRQICDGPALPKMEDQEYNRVRAEMSDAAFEAVEKGFETPVYKSGGNSTVTSASACSPAPSGDEVKDDKDMPKNSTYSTDSPEPGPSKSTGSKVLTVKRKMPVLKKTMLDEDLDSDVSTSDSEHDAEESTAKKVKLG